MTNWADEAATLRRWADRFLERAIRNDDDRDLERAIEYEDRAAGIEARHP